VIRDDARGRRVAIVADYLVNPRSGLYVGLPGRVAPVFDVLVEDGWGIMKPPPHVAGESIGRAAISNIAGDAVDYLDHGYEVVIVAVDGLPGGGVWLALLESALRDLDRPIPEVVRVGLEASHPPSTPAAIRAALGAVTARAR
jgi:hypothetical protein